MLTFVGKVKAVTYLGHPFIPKTASTDYNSIQFIYACNKGLWPKVQIQFQVLTISVIHGVQMLLILHIISAFLLIIN